MALTNTDKRSAQTRLLEPKVLASLANLELVAKFVVEGFVIGLHRSPKFGFSQEFAEYKSYAEGDDPRYIDWNVYSRTDRTFIKRFRGETNSHLMILLDASASMGYGSEGTTKLQYGKYLAASLAYLANSQHDAVGVMIFNDEVISYRPPMSRTGALQGVIHTIDKAEAVQGTSLHKPFSRFREHVRKRGMVVVISDFYCNPQEMLESVRPLAHQGNDIVLFQLLDPLEINPDIKVATLFEDMETGHAIEVSPTYMNKDYPARIRAHTKSIEEAARGVGADHVLVDTSQPLDKILHSYLKFREKRG
jgi:uncharacterized protein (DUF58 family)